MLRRLSCIAALALFAVASGARADGPQASPSVIQGWTGVTGPGLPFRYVTLPSGSSTVLAQVRRSTGRVWGFRSFRGVWGIPQVANDGTAGGLSRDGRLLVLSQWNATASGRSTSRFLLVSARAFHILRRVTLKGAFGFDALSPGARYLYLIEHVSSADLTSYRVRAYDLATHRLLRQVIADRRQASWTMQGYPVTRAASPDARWEYTLYQQPGGYPFVHALDTLARSAHCIGIPWRGSQDTLYSTKMRLHGRMLTLTTYDGVPLYEVDTKTFWVKRPQPGPLPLGLWGLVSSLR
jgi:hypothetical protein